MAENIFVPLQALFSSLKMVIFSRIAPNILKLFRQTTPDRDHFSNRDPVDLVVKGMGSNPDVMGSNPMTSRFFADPHLNILQVSVQIHVPTISAESGLENWAASSHGRATQSKSCAPRGSRLIEIRRT